MNGYICHFKGKQIEVYAETSYKAQLEAARIFKAKKAFMVTVFLVEKDGKSLLHKPMM